MSTATDTRVDLLRALGVLAEPPGPHHVRLTGLLRLAAPAGTDWTEAFMVQLVPHAAVYLGADGMLGGDAADRVAGFWRALRLPVPADADHLTTLLGLYATLIDAGQQEPDPARRALLGQARATLLHEHLLSWLPAYMRAMVDIGPPAYATWATLLADVLRAETTEVGVPRHIPAHLRALPPLAAAADGGLDGLLAALLAPARTGMILTRAHLAAVAHATGLGLRLGDRRRMLRALLEQDPRTALIALAGQADEWAGHHRADEPLTGAMARHWADRAHATAHLLRTAAHKFPPTGQEDDR